MVSYIWIEFKRRFISIRTVFAIALILIISFINIQEYNSKSRTSDNSEIYLNARTIQRMSDMWLDMYLEENENRLDPTIINSYKYMKDLGAQMQVALNNQDYKELNRVSFLGNVLYSKHIAINENPLREMSLKKQVNDMWIDLSDIPYDSIYFNNIGKKGDLPFYYYSLTQAKHDYVLYQENLLPIDPYYIDSSTFIYMYLNEVVPLIIGILILILTFDTINTEWSNGSQKMILSSIYSRRKYIISKVLVGTMYTVAVLVIPMVMISIGYGLFDGFRNLNYPVLFLKDGFTSFVSQANYMEFNLQNFGFIPSIGISQYSGYPKGEIGVHTSLTFIPLYQFLIIGLIMLIFCILFYVIVNTLISSMTKNSITGFVISILVTLGGTVISNPWTIDENYNLSPFTMNNPIRILNGTYNTTGLIALVILVSISILLLLFNLYYFKKKDL